MAHPDQCQGELFDAHDATSSLQKMLFRNELEKFWQDVAKPDLEAILRCASGGRPSSPAGGRTTSDGQRSSSTCGIHVSETRPPSPTSSAGGIHVSETRPPSPTSRKLGRFPTLDTFDRWECDSTRCTDQSGHDDQVEARSPVLSHEVTDPRSLLLEYRNPAPVSTPSEHEATLDKYEEDDPLLAIGLSSKSHTCFMLKQFVQEEKFEIIVAILISFNALLVGLQIYFKSCGWAAVELSMLGILNRLMCILFYLETALRIYCYQPTFHMYANNNRLDLTVIGALLCADMYSAIWHTYSVAWISLFSRHISVVRMVRTFRILRITHDPAILRMTRRFRVFVASFEDSFGSLICAFAYVLLFNYMIAVPLTDSIIEYNIESKEFGEDQTDSMLIIKLFGSIPATMLSLWEIMLDGYVCGVHWGKLLVNFYEFRPLWVSVLFIGFVSAAKLGVVTIISAIFTTVALKTAEDDNFFVLQTFTSEFFRDADKDGDKAISWDEFRENLRHPFLVEFFPDIARSPAKARRLFNRIDVDKSGECSLDELMYTLVRRATF